MPVWLVIRMVIVTIQCKMPGCILLTMTFLQPFPGLANFGNKVTFLFTRFISNVKVARQISSTIEYYRLIDYIFNDRFLSIWYALSIFMAGSANGQEKVYTAFWLPTLAGKMRLPCSLGIFKEGKIKTAGYWPQYLFPLLLTTTLCQAIKMWEKELSQYPAILTPIRHICPSAGMLVAGKADKDWQVLLQQLSKGNV